MGYHFILEGPRRQRSGDFVHVSFIASDHVSNLTFEWMFRIHQVNITSDRPLISKGSSRLSRPQNCSRFDTVSHCVYRNFIHSPPPQVFDRILLLQKGGRTVYFGDLGTNAVNLLDYFEHQGARRCKADENP
jgi:hypothetical protein